MCSPGRPEPSRALQRRFWRVVAAGVTTTEAVTAVGVSVPVGARWFRHAGGMPPISLAEPGSLSMFLCKRGWLEVGVDAVWVGGGQLGEGLFPVGGGLALDEAGLGPALAGGFASVSFAFESAFVLDVADRQPQ